MVSKVESTEEIEKMRIAGRLAASVLEMIEEHITPGVSTEELNKTCHDYIVNDIDCIPAPLNYGGGPNQIPFPKLSIEELLLLGRHMLLPGPYILQLNILDLPNDNEHIPKLMNH